jgi:ATP-binding cassette subfamily F protein uup
METLELLEELLGEFQGSLLLVSHDRAFLDNVVTSTLVFEGEGKISEYVGGYSDWLRQRPTPKPASTAAKTPDPARAAPKPATPPQRKKLSNKEQRELERLPGEIEALEARQAELNAAIHRPDFYRQDRVQVDATLAELGTVESRLEASYARWEELDQAAAGT